MLDECAISNTVTTSLFDHKCISLYIKKKSQQKNKVPKLTNTFLNSKYLDLSVTTAAIEANVLSIDESCNDNVPANYNSSADLVADMKIKLADLKRIIKELESLELQKAKSDQDVHLNLLVAAKAASGFLAIENMVPMETIEKLKKKCTHSRFFEVLVEQTKKMGMRAQKKLSYNEYVRKSEIRSRIDNLKKNYTANQTRIFDLERDLGRIIDNELRDRMMDLKIFDCLHAEKATSHFLNLAKKTSRGESLEKVRKPDGTDFESENERSDYITNFYSSLYRKDETVEGEIENFLGPAACSHPLVTGSKLTEAEREALDAPLRIEELDISLNKANG
jgi:hypothetical protein